MECAKRLNPLPSLAGHSRAEQESKTLQIQKFVPPHIPPGLLLNRSAGGPQPQVSRFLRFFSCLLILLISKTIKISHVSQTLQNLKNLTRWCQSAQCSFWSSIFYQNSRPAEPKLQQISSENICSTSQGLTLSHQFSIILSCFTEQFLVFTFYHFLLICCENCRFGDPLQIKRAP